MDHWETNLNNAVKFADPKKHTIENRTKNYDYVLRTTGVMTV